MQRRRALPLKTIGNFPTSWKTFKDLWDNHGIVAEYYRFENNFKTGTFLSCIGDDAGETNADIDFPTEEDRSKFDIAKVAPEGRGGREDRGDQRRDPCGSPRFL